MKKKKKQPTKTAKLKIQWKKNGRNLSDYRAEIWREGKYGRKIKRLENSPKDLITERMFRVGKETRERTREFSRYEEIGLQIVRT